MVASTFATTTSTSANLKTTPITTENYGLAESQVIFTSYVEKIATATNTNGLGVFMHNKKGADPKDRTVMRINLDTLYSLAILNLTEGATLIMHDINGRYQTAWIISEEHYNPFAFNSAGGYTLTQENVGTRYVMVAIRTQANTADPEDVAQANALQEQLVLKQADCGNYMASDQWDMSEMLAMRAKYEQLVKEKSIPVDVMFGKKGEVLLENHNCGTAVGWGGFTPEEAVYLMKNPSSDAAHSLTLKDVPVNAFWSITIYDKDGYPQGDVYNINSAFATPNVDGSVTINFGGEHEAPNCMDIFEGWNYTLRMYQPTEEYFNGSWTQPKLQLA